MSTDPKCNYYDAGGIEVFRILEAKLTPEQLLGYHLGNAIVYDLRLNFKHEALEDKARDAEKAAIHNQEAAKLLRRICE